MDKIIQDVNGNIIKIKDWIKIDNKYLDRVIGIYYSDNKLCIMTQAFEESLVCPYKCLEGGPPHVFKFDSIKDKIYKIMEPPISKSVPCSCKEAFFESGSEHANQERN